MHFGWLDFFFVNTHTHTIHAIWISGNEIPLDHRRSARNSKTSEKSSVMWLNTIVGRTGTGAASKALSSVRYSSMGLHGRTASGQIILPLDVEETVTCFCRFDLCIWSSTLHFIHTRLNHIPAIIIGQPSWSSRCHCHCFVQRNIAKRTKCW